MEQEHLEITKAKLAEAKPRVRLFGLDYDGTVSDVEHKQLQVFELAGKILDQNKSVGFITASATTALKKLAPPAQELLSKKNGAGRIFIAGGNGATLHEVKKDNVLEVYRHDLDLSQVRRAAAMGKQVYEKLGLKNSDLVEKGKETFKKFLQDDWTGSVPSEIIDVGRSYNGELFTEQAKVTFVLPKDKSLHDKIAEELNRALGEDLVAAVGDDTYIHITKKLEEDGKVVAVKTILKLLGLKPEQVATFGDMPLGNDAGLLTFPYSFTNAGEFLKIKKDPTQPPYVLVDSDLTPVARVYQAIESLLL